MKVAFPVMLAALSLACISCRTFPPLPPVDLTAGSWNVLRGQAVWKRAPNRPELAGELLLATDRDGNQFIQFAKPPFTLATARAWGARWEIDLGNGEYVRRGNGVPPTRFVWFQLAGIESSNVSANWNVTQGAEGSWHLANDRTGETLEGRFFR